MTTEAGKRLVRELRRGDVSENWNSIASWVEAAIPDIEAEAAERATLDAARAWRPPANDEEVEQARLAGWEPFIEFGDGSRISASVASEKNRTELPGVPVERHQDEARNAALAEYERSIGIERKTEDDR